jgi:hypothetical protein
MTMHDYKGWRIGVEAFEREGRWSARVEASEPGTGPRSHVPMPLPFNGSFESAEEAETAAVKSAERWIDGPGGGGRA